MARSKEKKVGKVGKPTQETYEEGDLVFAKVKGYKPWPAVVIEVSANARFQVFFYGTYQTSFIKPIDLEPYNEETVAKYQSNKAKQFKNAMEEIQKDPDIYKNLTNLDIEDEPKTKEKPSELQEKAETPKRQGKAGTPKTPVPKEALVKTPVQKEALVKTPVQKEALVKTPVQREALVKTPVQREVVVQRTPRAANKRKAEEKETEIVQAQPEPSLKAKTKSRKKKDEDVSSPSIVVPVVDMPRNDPKMYYQVPGSSELVEIEIGRNKPKFNSKEEEEEWNKGSIKNLAILQEALNSGNYLPDEVRRVLKAKGNRTNIEEELLKIPQHKPISDAEIQLLKDESRLIELNYDLRESFSLGNADMTKGLRLLNLMNEINLTKLQVLKNPEIEETFWELMVFYEEDHLSNIKAKVDQARRIRDMATGLHQKIRALFNIDDDEEFKTEFPRILEKFHDSTGEMQENERYYLTEIPSIFNA